MSVDWNRENRGADRRVSVSPDAQAVADRVGARLISRLVELTASQDAVHVALTGGSVGIALLRSAADRPEVVDVDWNRVHFWWSDERFVPAADGDRNDLQAREALLDRVPVPAANIHAVATSDSGVTAEEAAAQYARELAGFAPVAPDGTAPDSTAPDSTAQAWPSFDICLLGVGPDAHIASLFPDRPEVRITDEAVVAVFDSPKPPPVRITMTRPVINSSIRMWLMITGSEKASALGLALAGANYASVPVAGAKGRRRTRFFVDTAAAAEVPHELIDPS